MRLPSCALGLVCLTVLIAAPSCASPSAQHSERGRITLIEPEDDPQRFVIPRDRYDDAVLRGPSWFIQQVAVEPVVVGRSFRGFMLTRLFGGNEAQGLLVGDIVQRVNGRSIERPDQFMRVWQQLKGAEHLTVQIVRHNKPLELTWAIR